MPWVRAKLRGNTVYARADASGQLVTKGGRVDVLYRTKGGRLYRASPDNLDVEQGSLVSDDECGPGDDAPKGAPSSKGANGGGSVAGAWQAWTDGACSGNPGPCGLGVVLQKDAEQVEISEYLGHGTNNIAELTAILRALERTPADQPLIIHTDSQYSIGVLQKGWKAKANAELIATIRKELSQRSSARLVYTPGHAGVALNEHADMLARTAAASASSSVRTRPLKPAASPSAPGEA